MLTPLGSQEADALAWVHDLATDLPVGTADCVQRKTSHHSAQVGWHIAKDAGLPLTYSDLVNVVILHPVCFR